MQIHHQRMDCDESIPIKQITNQNQSQNGHNLVQKTRIKINTKSKTTKSGRTFGADITNQSRNVTSTNNIPTNVPTKSRIKNNGNDGFNFIKTKPLKMGELSQTDTDIEDIEICENETNENESEESAAQQYVNDAELAEWDAMDIENDLCVVDYVSDIISNLREDERVNRNGCIIENNLDFMSAQTDVNARMRSVLVDWLVEVHRKFKLLPNTYFLAINILDRFLVKAQLHRRKLQLCGCTALWIASKYHEIYAPEMDDFIYISDNAFTETDLQSMEIEILKTLGFALTVPTVYNYTQRYQRISSFYLKKKKEMKIIADLILYLVEHCVMSYELCRYKPSLLAGAAFVYACIATKVFSVERFKKDRLDAVIGYRMDELRPVMTEIDQIAKNVKKCKHKAVLKKYSNQKFSNVGKLNFGKLKTHFLKE